MTAEKDQPLTTLTVDLVAQIWRDHASCNWVSDGVNVRWTCGIIHPGKIHTQPTTRDRHFAALMVTQIEAERLIARRAEQQRFLEAARKRLDERAAQPTPPAQGDCGHGHLTPEAQRGCDEWTASVSAPPAQAKAVAVVERVRALADDLWRVSPCGCGHRADLHTIGRYSNEPSVCIGGLGLCGCDWSFTRIIQTRLRAALAPADTGEGE